MKEDKKMQTQVAVTQTEVKHIKKQLDEIVPKIEEMHTTFIKGEGKISTNKERICLIEKSLNGNGKPGLIQEVKEINNRIAYYVGGATAVISIITILINVYI